MISYNEIDQRSFRGYILIFISQFLSLIGSQIVSFAVIWYLTDTTGSSMILSVASIANIVPMIIISPFAGVISDRISKNVLLVLTDALQAAATLVLIILFKLGVGNIWFMIGLLGVRGLCQGFQLPALTTITSLLVPKSKIKTINSVEQILRSILSISSPAFGAILYARFSMAQIYWLDVFTFLPTAVVLFLIRIPSVRSKTEAQAGSFKDDFKEGLQYIKSSGLLSVFMSFAVANFIVVPIFSLFSLLVRNFHEGTAGQYGVTEALFQVGLLLGSIALMISKREPNIKSVIYSAVLLSAILLALGIVPKGTWWLFFGLCGSLGICLAFIDTQLISVLQLTIPKELQGRVFSTMFTLIKSINPLGLIMWGLIGEVLPIRWIFILSPAISLIIYFILMQITNVLKYGHEKPGNTDPESTSLNNVNAAATDSIVQSDLNRAPIED